MSLKQSKTAAARQPIVNQKLVFVIAIIIGFIMGLCYHLALMELKQELSSSVKMVIVDTFMLLYLGSGPIIGIPTSS